MGLATYCGMTIATLAAARDSMIQLLDHRGTLLVVTFTPYTRQTILTCLIEFAFYYGRQLQPLWLCHQVALINCDSSSSVYTGRVWPPPIQERSGNLSVSSSLLLHVTVCWGQCLNLQQKFIQQILVQPFLPPPPHTHTHTHTIYSPCIAIQPPPYFNLFYSL